MLEPRALTKPKALRPGDRVALVAPASDYDPEALANGAAVLESWDLIVELPAPADPLRYLAAQDEVRAERLTEAFARDDVAAIIGVRGGYGSARLHGRFDAEIAITHPKIFVGYSDLTILLARLRSEAGLLCFHGPMAASDLTRLVPGELERFRRFLFGEEGWWAGDELIGRIPGVAKGRLAGGCLSVIISTLGTPYEIDTRGTVLFLEEINEAPFRIDRMLTQLLHAGKLKHVSAVVLGTFHRCDRPEAAGETLRIATEIIGKLGIPMVSGMDAGHESGGAVLPIGCEVRVDGEKGSMELLEPVFVGRASAIVSASEKASAKDLARLAASAARRGPGLTGR